MSIVRGVDTLQVERADAVVTITLDRPERKNAIDRRITYTNDIEFHGAAKAAAPLAKVVFEKVGHDTEKQLTDEKLLAADPAWSPDSQTIAFVAIGSRNQLFAQPVGGVTEVVLLVRQIDVGPAR